MRLQSSVSEQIQRVVEALALPPSANLVAAQLVGVDLDPQRAAEARARDEYGREGVVSWSLLAELLSGRPLDELASAALSLVDWGLAQLVGQSAADVQIAGSAVLRLTFAGRSAFGLAPSRGPTAPLPAELSGWTVLHGSSRERLLRAARERVGPAAPLVRLPVEASGMDHAIGEIAAAAARAGAVIVDASEGRAEPVLSALLQRTATARAVRLLLVNDPRPLRLVAAETGATLRWVPDPWAHGSAGQDPALTLALLAADPGAARQDVCGVPASSIARPRAVSVPWSALDLPAAAARRLELVRHHAQARSAVQDGKSPRVGGYRLLLCGLPGTGKSMAASALATTLERPLLKIDLSTVLSKWLGETEKMLGELFDLAEASGALLVLDEAESLFRQRDSGPNGSSGLGTAVAWLLSRLDDFGGALVATTNRLEDLDEAFYRRFDDLVILPMPDAATRRRLWGRYFGSADAALELDELADRFVISGGLIEGAALRARAWAHSTGDALTMGVVLASLVLELEKSGRSSREVFASKHGEAVRAVLGMREA